MAYSTSNSPMLTPPVVALRLTNAQGERYMRIAAVQTQLEELVALNTRAAQEARIALPDQDAMTYVRAESVAYFVRECHRKHDRSAGDWLAVRTLERCEGFILRHLYGLHGEEQNDACSTVVEQMFRSLFDLEHPQGEYYQVYFWSKLKRQCVDAYRTGAHAARHAMVHVTHGRVGEDSNEMGPLDLVPDPGALPDALTQDEDTVRRALRYLHERLPERQCNAFALRFLAGWPIGDRGVDGTIAAYYDVSPKSINNWINAVKRELRIWWETEGHA